MMVMIFLCELYDGPPKEYPNGVIMMLFLLAEGTVVLGPVLLCRYAVYIWFAGLLEATHFPYFFFLDTYNPAPSSRSLQISVYRVVYVFQYIYLSGA